MYEKMTKKSLLAHRSVFGGKIDDKTFCDEFYYSYDLKWMEVRSRKGLNESF